MKKWLGLMAALLMCGMMAAGIHAEELVEVLTCEMAGETMMRPLAAGSAADLEAVDGMDLDAFRAYLAAEMDKRNTQINIASYGIPYSQEYGEAIFDFIHVEMPEYFHANVTSLSYYTGGDIVYINVKYTMTASEYAAELDVWNAAVDQMLAGLDGLGDVEKALLLHDRLAEHCEYDYQNLLNGTIPESSYRAYGVLVKGTAVCQGYAEVYQYLLGKVGIDAWLNSSEKLNHVWNILEIDGKKYHVDVTWDDPVWDIGGRVLHTNFLCSSAVFAQSHEATDYDTTPSDTTYDDYFWRYSDTAFQLLDGEIYCIANDVENDTSLLTYEDALNAYNGVGTGDEALADADDTWWAGSNSYWGGNYSRLVTDGEYLYFNKSKSVYRYDVESGAIMSVVTPQHSFGDYFSIFGMWYDDGYLYCEMSNTPNFDGSTKANYTLSYTLSSDVHTHSFTEEIVDDEYLVSEASCTMPAVYYYSCSCGAVSPDSAFAYGEALGHSAGEAWESDESYHWHICTVCGEAVEKAVHEPDREGGATEEYAVICTECEYVIEKQLEHVHVYDREVADEKYLYAEATCISPAEYYLSCTCGEMGNRIFAYGEALGHDTADVPWYCDEEYHWRYCDRCDELADEDMHTPDHEGGATEEYAVICTVCEYVIEEQLESVKEPVQLSVSDMVIRAGQTAEMVISIDQLPTKGLGYLKLAIAYDDTILELVDAVSTDIIGTCTMSKSIDNKPFIVIWDSIDDQQETGELLRLTFRALRPESYTGTEPLVQIECREADDRYLNTVECTVGAFETELLIPGDANEDGTVNGRDLILIRQYVAEYQGITMDTRTGDVNADGVINGKDVIVMRQYLAEWGVTLL